MVIVLLVIFAVLFVLGCIVDEDYIARLGGLLTIGCIIAIIGLISAVINGRVLDDKITMYSEENTKIETSIDNLVSEYMIYESETFAELKNGEGITLINLYPDLKADELVRLQLETYQANNAKIKELKESKLNITLYKWWLYFGK